MLIPCHGVSPNNYRWVHAMPQHTGTATIHNYINNNNLSTKPCLHSHDAIFPKDTTFTFSFVANPFRRVLSNAFHRGIINNYDNESVREFRNFVFNSFCVRHFHPTPHCIWVQYSFLNRFPKPITIFPTSQLDTGFHNILNTLGYKNIFTKFDQHHCVASCSDTLSYNVPGTRSHVKLKENVSFFQMINNKHVKWFDVKTEQKVLDLFKRDFEYFNFSTVSDYMWDSRGDARNLKLN